MNLSKLGTKTVWGFAFYDFANSAYILIFNAYLFPLFLKTKVLDDKSSVDFVWSLLLSISLIVALIIGPFLGKYADVVGRRKTLTVAVLGSFLGMILLSFLPYTSIFIYCLIFVVTNIFFTLSLSVYDSLLNHIAPQQSRSTVSGFAWGFGYLGGILCLLGVLGLKQSFPQYERAGFIFTALFYIVVSLFSLNAMRKIKESHSVNQIKTRIKLPLKTYIFILLAVWLICEGIDVVIYFSSLFGSTTLNLSQMEIGKLLVIVQLLAFPSTWLIIRKSQKIGIRTVLNLSILLWILICISLYFANSYNQYLILTIATSLVIGTSQALLRGEFSKLIPDNASAFHFGLFSISMRSANFLGPIIFGITSSIAGNQRLGFLIIVAFFLIGIILYNLYVKSGYPTENYQGNPK